MPDLYQATRVAKVPSAAVVDPGDIVYTPVVGRVIDDPWVHVAAGAKVDLSAWPDDRTTPSPVRNKAPEKHLGAGTAAKEKLIARGVLVPPRVELPPDPAVQRTHPETNIFREDGSVRTVEVRATEDDKPTAKPARAKPARKGGR